MTTLRIILGDQLNTEIAALRGIDPSRDVILMMEVMGEATYVRHHPKKIALIFSAMRHFADQLRAQGVRVDYIALDDPENTGSFADEIKRAIVRHAPERIVVTHPGEYRVLTDLRLIGSIDIREDDRFISTVAEFSHWAGTRKNLRMEFFYREMRKKTGLLMRADGTPEGGEWNLDKENRKTLPRGQILPPRRTFEPDAITRDVLDLVESRFSSHFGTLRPFDFAVTRAEALTVLDDFITHRLPFFGDYQDAMKQGEPWMFHSHLSFYLNCGLLLPLEVCTAAQAAYESGHAPLNAVEGFIRQIIGWREYVRGIYWLNMPDYKELNALTATRPLPRFFWDTDTDMNCLKQVITETRDNAYAHHIQRLMITGNFALLAGLDVDAVNEWYMIVYADAYEWVELPNVSGMILYADDGYLASKPYAAGGGYINKMSDYCKSCRYRVQEKTGPDACPFNYLYWDFLDRHRERFERNPRLAMIYRTWANMSDAHKTSVRTSARTFLESLV